MKIMNTAGPIPIPNHIIEKGIHAIGGIGLRTLMTNLHNVSNRSYQPNIMPNIIPTVDIMRLGNLMSRYSDGVFQKNYDTNAFLNNIKAINKLKAINPVMANTETDMSQIDCVAKGILELSKTPEKCRVFHCMNNHYIPLRNMVDALNTYGNGIEEVDVDRFKQIYQQNMNENIQGIITADLAIEDLDEENDFDENVKIELTTEILHSLGFDWPQPDENYLKRLIDYLNELNYFE